MRRPPLYLLALALLVCGACAVRKPAHPWQYVNRSSAPILIPPDLSTADVANRTFHASLPPGGGRCQSLQGGIAIRTRTKHATITVDRETLLRQPPGWLARWAAQLERDHCTAPGAGTDLAVQVADSLPLDPHASLRLLYPGVQVGEVMLDSNSGIRLNTPLWRIPGVGLVAEGPYEVSGRDSSLMLTAKSTDNLIGVETVMYLVKPRAAGPGFTLAPIYADRLIDGVTERRPKPTNDILQFASEVSFYEVFYKSWANDFTAILVGARTPAELDHAVQQLKTNPGASCATLKNKTCIALPKDYGLTLLVSVTVNGSQQFLSRGATVFNAIRSSGENQPDRVLPQLRILRQWNGRPIPVAFDPSDRTILNLPLRGGETISWR